MRRDGKQRRCWKELLRGYEVIDRPPVRGKDYNDLLRYRRDAQRGEAR